MLKRLLILLSTAAVLLGLQYFFKVAINDYVTQIVVAIGINILMATSLNLISGFTGQFSLGHAGFMAIGAYVSAALSVYLAPKLPQIFWIQQLLFVCFLFFGGMAAAIAGFIIGLPSLRLKGDYLAIVTLGFGEIIRVIILNMDLVGGARGFTGIPERANFFWVFFVVVCSLIFLKRMIYSVRGLSFMAVRDNEIAAQSIGISPTRVKVTAFVTGSFFAGVGGGLFAHFFTYLNTSTFGFLKSIDFIAMVVLGGMGSLTGSVISATLLTCLPEVLRSFSDYRMIVYAILLIVIMMKRPQGLMGQKEWIFRTKPKNDGAKT